MTSSPGPDPLRLRPHGLQFEDLKHLSEYLEQMLLNADASLNFFRDPIRGGFQHKVDPGVAPKKSSKASTSTCLAYLRAAGKLVGPDWDKKKAPLRDFFIKDEWTSAELDEDNPFTVAFLLDAFDALGGFEGLGDESQSLVNEKVKLMNDALAESGGLSIPPFPPTAFLTHKVVRVLRQLSKLEPEAAAAASEWAWTHLFEESMLIAADSPDADFFELAYAVLTASSTSLLDRMTPRERRLLQHGIEQFFGGQRDDGTWPRSRPLFLYPTIGYAYCYDYELLVYALSDRQIARFLFPHLGELRKAAWALDSRRVPLELPATARRPAFGWSSEHQARSSQAESWPTASVFHFCLELSRLVADAIRRDVFEYVDVVYEEPLQEAPTVPPLEDLMDSDVEYEGGRVSFKAVFTSNFVEPLIRGRDAVRDGRQFENHAKVSAIMYGPPGTSKTRIARMIADALGWPLLALDPSHLTRRGLDNVHAEADSLFGRLRFCDQMVVLLDEFDELVREREAAGDLTSRFLTTAMLPKITALHARRRIVYLVATNHVEQFDAAISRPGRFDVIIPVMPPSAQAKLASPKFASLKEAIQVLDKAKPKIPDLTQIIGDLTYAEAEDLAEKVAGVKKITPLRDLIDRAKGGATLNQAVLDSDMAATVGATDKASEITEPADKPKPKPETWKERIESQQSKIRGLGL